jgi:hypothetical protein
MKAYNGRQVIGMKLHGACRCQWHAPSHTLLGGVLVCTSVQRGTGAVAIANAT